MSATGGGDGGVAQVHDERVEIVGQALRRGGEPAVSSSSTSACSRCLASRSLIASSSSRSRSGSLAYRLRARCTQQRWRSDAGQQCSIALVSPGAPSATISVGAPRPRAIRSRPRACQSSLFTAVLRRHPLRSPSRVFACAKLGARRAAWRWLLGSGARATGCWAHLHPSDSRGRLSAGSPKARRRIARPRRR